MPKEIQTPVAPATPEPVAPVTPVKPDITEAIAHDAAVAKILGSKKPAAKPAVVEPVKPVEAPVVPVAATPATPVATPEPAKPQVKVRKPQPQKPAIDTEAIARAVSEGVSKVLPKAPEPAAAPVIELPEHLAEMRPIYEKLEEINPAKYKGIVKKQADFAQKELTYATQWEDRERARLTAEGKADEANSVTYNPDDPQHAHFYDRYAPQIDPRDIRRAEVKMELDELRKADAGTQNGEVEKLKNELKQFKAEPIAQAAESQFGAGLFQTLNPESNGDLSPQAFQKWAEANPIEAEVSSQLQQQVRPIVHATSMLWDNATPFDQNDQSHVQAAAAFNYFEQSLAGQAEPVVNDQGQSWIPLADYVKLSKNKQAEHFTTTKQVLVNYISLQTAQRVKQIAKQQQEIIDKHAARLGYQKPQVPSATPASTPSAPAKPAAPLASPSVSGSSPTPPSAGVAPAPVVENSSWMDKMLGKK